MEAKEYLKSKGYSDWYFQNDGVIVISDVVKLLESFQSQELQGNTPPLEAKLPTEEEIRKAADYYIETKPLNSPRYAFCKGAKWAISNDNRQQEGEGIKNFLVWFSGRSEAYRHDTLIEDVVKEYLDNPIPHHLRKKKCSGCNVREGHEHRCHGSGCVCDYIVCKEIQSTD